MITKEESQFQVSVSQSHQEVQECLNRLRRVRNEREEKERLIARFERSEQNTLYRYGANFVTLVSEIKKYRGWRQQPVGPLGEHITVKNDRCVLAVETCLKRLMQVGLFT